MSFVSIHKHDGAKSTQSVCEKELVSLLLKLSRQGLAEDLQQLIRQYKKEIKYFINKTDNSKLAALHYAARNEAIDCVRILVEEGGADVNVKTNEQSTPLHFAARYRRQSNEPTTEFIGATPIGSKSNGHRGARANKLTDDSLMETPSTTETLQPSESLENPGSTEKLSEKMIDYDGVIHYLIEHGADINGQDANGWTALHYAAIRGNEVASKQLLQESGIDIELGDHDGMRPLHLATSHNEIEIVQCLLNTNANPFAVTQRGCLPIHFACATGNVDLVRLILRHSGSVENCTASLNAPNRDGESPLHWAIVNGHEKVVEFCLQNNTDPNLTPLNGETSLHMAARVGSVNIARLLIKVGGNVDAEDTDHQTALHKAAERNNVDVVKLLLKRGSNVENEDDNACTALLLAVSKGHVETVQLLIEHNANMFAQDKTAKSIIYKCAEENRLEVLRLILSYRVAKRLINVPNIYGNTPLHVAAKLGHLEIVKLLFDTGANQMAKNERERLPFHYAAKHGRFHITRLCLRKSPGIVSELDEDGNSAIHLAAGRGHQNVTELLLKYGAAVDSRNSMRWTPLDCAAANGHRACAQFLLENDSPVDPRDVSNTTPLHLACKHGHDRLVQLLLDWGADPGVRMVINENSPDCGPNALDNAIDHGNKSCALILLHSSKWKRALRNQTIGEKGIITTPMRKLIMKMPDVAEVVMDRCVTSNSANRDDDEGAIEVYDFGFLEDTYSQWSKEAIIQASDIRRSKNTVKVFTKRLFGNGRKSAPQKTVNVLQFATSHEPDVKSHKHPAPYTRDKRVLTKNHPLMLMIKYKRAHLLEHKLVKMLLRRKWARTGIVYYINLLMYIVFLALYSTYMLSTQSVDLVLRKNSSLSNYTASQACSKKLLDNLNETHFPKVSISKYVVLSFSIFSLAKEVCQILFTGYRYFNLENIMEFSIFVMSILSVIDPDSCLSTTGLKEGWQWQCGAVGVFLAWLNLLLFLRRIPTLGLFVLMFTVIIGTFAKFFAVFFLFIVAFAFGFHILLSNHRQFNTLQNSLIKTSVMTLGEFEFDSIFNAQFSSTDYADSIYFGGITYSLFVTFLIIMTLVIMNLLVGLAVDDIKGVQNQAVVKRLAMQIQLLLDIDSLLPHCIRRRIEKKKFTVYRSNGSKCSASNWPRCINVFRHRLNTESPQNDEAGEDDSGVIQRRLSSLEERLSEIHTDQKTIISALNQVTVVLRGLHGQTISPTDVSDLEAIRRGSILNTPHNSSPRSLLSK